MKVLELSKIKRDRQITRTLNERKMMEDVRHEFIVYLHYCFLRKNYLCFVIDFCQGGEMFSHVANGLDEERVRFYGAQVVSALSYMHSLGIIYRDLKPENVMMCEDGYIKLIDFGYCKFNMNTSDYTYSICGTPEYYAPELLNRSGHTINVDWWTLGCFLYECMFGKCPFKHKDSKKLKKLIFEAKVEFPDESKKVSSKFKHLITSLITVEQQDRLGSKGSEEVKKHAFFAKVDFDILSQKGYKPVFKPSFENNIDTSYFDTSYVDKNDQFMEDYYMDFKYNLDDQTKELRKTFKEVYYNKEDTMPEHITQEEFETEEKYVDYEKEQNEFHRLNKKETRKSSIGFVYNVAIIGTSVAGCILAKNLDSKYYKIDIYERGSKVKGRTSSRVYNGINLNTSRSAFRTTPQGLIAYEYLRNEFGCKFIQTAEFDGSHKKHLIKTLVDSGELCETVLGLKEGPNKKDRFYIVDNERRTKARNNIYLDTDVDQITFVEKDDAVKIMCMDKEYDILIFAEQKIETLQFLRTYNMKDNDGYQKLEKIMKAPEKGNVDSEFVILFKMDDNYITWDIDLLEGNLTYRVAESRSLWTMTLYNKVIKANTHHAFTQQYLHLNTDKETQLQFVNLVFNDVKDCIDRKFEKPIPTFLDFEVHYERDCRIANPPFKKVKNKPTKSFLYSSYNSIGVVGQFGGYSLENEFVSGKEMAEWLNNNWDEDVLEDVNVL